MSIILHNYREHPWQIKVCCIFIVKSVVDQCSQHFRQVYLNGVVAFNFMPRKKHLYIFCNIIKATQCWPLKASQYLKIDRIISTFIIQNMECIIVIFTFFNFISSDLANSIISPCGACRQFLVEVNIKVFKANPHNWIVHVHYPKHGMHYRYF